jgi:transcription-repair coupling factor (superfamily II helicase)
VVLRRAGYLETNASDVWSGGFCVCDGAVEIRPARSKEVVRVTFAGDQIDEVRSDGVLLTSFKLEPEILSNEVSSKAGRREVLSYD